MDSKPRTVPWKRVLVTGGGGFIGGAIVPCLLQLGVESVTVTDAQPVANWTRLRKLVADPRVHALAFDLLDSEALTAAVEGTDLVIHLAAGTDMRRGSEDRGWDLRQGLQATQSVLDAMVAASVEHIAFASSSAVYGMLAVERPAAETDGPLLPISLYGAGKVAAEALTSAYCGLFGLRASIVRFGTVVGASMDRGAMPSFVAQALSPDRRIQVLGDGSQARSFVPVEDAAAALLYVAARSSRRCDITNIASPGSTSIRRVTEILVEEHGPTDVSFGEEAQGWTGDVPRVELDVSKLVGMGWQPRATSDQAVRETLRALLSGGVQLRSDEPNADARGEADKGTE